MVYTWQKKHLELAKDADDLIEQQRASTQLGLTYHDMFLSDGDHNSNIGTVREAMKVMDELKKEEQNLKKLERNTEMARGMAGERKCLLKQNASLDCLVEKSRMIFLWIKAIMINKPPVFTIQRGWRFH